jgi:hypothetical protein
VLARLFHLQLWPLNIASVYISIPTSVLKRVRGYGMVFLVQECRRPGESTPGNVYFNGALGCHGDTSLLVQEDGWGLNHIRQGTSVFSRQ